MAATRRSLGAVGVVLLVAAIGCSAPDESPTPSRAATSAAATSAENPPPPGLAGVADEPAAGLTGSLLQFRRDVPARRLEVRLTASNDGLVAEGLQLMSPGLTVAPAAPRGAVLRAGAALDLPVVAGASDCTVDAGPPRAVVRLSDATGAHREVAVPLDDDGLAERLHEADCFEQALRAQVAVDLVGVDEVSGPALQATVRMRRVGGSDPVRVTATASNTVYSITAAGPLPTLGGRSAVTFQLRLVPARCDVHALGESYRTGLIGLMVGLGDRPPQPLVLTPEPDVRRRIEAFAVETCRARGD
jgi:hypothetical protein